MDPLANKEGNSDAAKNDEVRHADEDKSSAWDDWRRAYDIEDRHGIKSIPSECLDDEVLNGIRIRTMEWFENVRLVQDVEHSNEETLRLHRDESITESSPRTRLLKWKDGIITEFALDQMPPYVAISHVWAHQLFPIDKRNDVSSAHGMMQLNLFLRLRSDIPGYQYLRIDTWCIDQDDEQDKMRQIPLMADIYSNAIDVLVMTLADFGFWQMDWNSEVEALGQAVRIYQLHGPRSAELQSCFRENQIGHAALKLLEMITTLSKMAVNERIWTAQEYILARRVAWIDGKGLDLRVDPIIVCAVIDMVDTFLQLREQTAKWIDQVLDFHLLNKLKFTTENPTAVMGLAQSRCSTLEHDQIYGLMGASGVVIDAKEAGTESVRDTWRRWFRSAILQGHYQWLSAPVTAPSTSGAGARNCAFASFRGSSKLTRQIDLEGSKWLSPALWAQNAIITRSRLLGVVEDVRYVGDLAKGWFTSPGELSTQLTTNENIPEIVAAATSGRLSKKGVSRLAGLIQPLLDFFYKTGESELFIGKQRSEDLAKIFPYDSEISIKDVMNEHVRGTTYLGTLGNEHTRTSILFVSEEPIPPDPLIAVDIGAYDMSNNKSLWRTLCIGKPFDYSALSDTILQFSCHKVGTSYPVLVADPQIDISQAQDLNIHIADLGETLPLFIGGDHCQWCRALDTSGK